MKSTALSRAERNRLVELIDLLNDGRVTQLDTDEEAEVARLWSKLTEADDDKS